MILFNGKKPAKKILLDLKERIRKEKFKPKLAVISVGSNLASELFIKNKKRAAKKAGIEVVHYKYKKNIEVGEIIKKIKNLNVDASINGIIVQLPLPQNLNAKRITNANAKKK